MFETPEMKRERMARESARWVFDLRRLLDFLCHTYTVGKPVPLQV